MKSHVQWFYADSQKQQQGPVSFEQIQQLAASGQIEPATLIWNEGMANWTAASEVQGVFNAPAAMPAPMSDSGANPYSAPGASGFPTSVGGGYPIPVVKKCSFPLYAVFLFLTVALTLTWVVPVVGKTLDVLQEGPPDVTLPETREEAEQAEKEIRQFQDPEIEEIFTENELLQIGGLVLASIFFGLIWLIVSCIYLYRAWCVLQPGGARTSPGKAVGFLFIPLFNFYWAFVAYHGWAQDWNRIQAGHQNLVHIPRASEGLFLAACICYAATLVPVLGYLAMLLTVFLFLPPVWKMCKVVNAMADARK